MTFIYAPFLSEYWPVVLAGLLCFVAAKFVYKATVALQKSGNSDAGRANGDVRIRRHSSNARTPDESMYCKNVCFWDSMSWPGRHT